MTHPMQPDDGAGSPLDERAPSPYFVESGMGLTVSNDSIELDFSLPPGVRSARFERLYSELELERAVLAVYTRPLFLWRKALVRSHDGRTLYDFAARTGQNVSRLHQALKNRSFHFREGLPVAHNFNGRIRTIYVFPWEERIVDLLLYRLCNRAFHSAISRHAYAYRWRGFGLDECQHRICRRLAKSAPAFVLKRDVADYFPSIDHGILLTALRRWVEPDDYLYELLAERVRFHYRAQDDVATATRGVPFGTASACFLANCFLTPLDRAVGEMPGVRYFRYADDILLIADSGEVAANAAARMDAVIAALKLTSKPSHHQEFQLRGGNDTGSPVATKFRHLGLEFRADGSVGLSRDKGRKIRNLFRYAFRRARRRLTRLPTHEQRAQAAIELANEIVERGVRSVAIIDYYLKHVDDEEQLRQLDRWLAEEVLVAAFHDGHRRGNFRRLSFRQLRRMGLPSLRHRRRLLCHNHLRSRFFVMRTERLIERERRWLSGKPAFSPRLEAAAEAGENAGPVGKGAAC